MTSLPAGDPPLDPIGAPAAPLVVAHRAARPSSARRCCRCSPPWPPATCARGCAAARASSGWGRAASRTASGPDRFAELEAWWRDAGRQRRGARRGRPPGHRAGRLRVVRVRRDSAAGATLVVPEVVVGMRGGVAWLTTVGVEPAPAVPAVPGRRRSPGSRCRRRRSTSPSPTARCRARRVGRCRGRGGRADHRRAARQGRAGPRPRRHRPASRSTCAGCCTGWPSSYRTTLGVRASTGSSARRPSCWCAARRGW